MSSSVPDWSNRFQPLEDLIKKWKQVGLRAQIQGPIESDAARVSAEREHLLSGRKHLMQLTKEYSKLEEPSEKLQKLGPLIKAFQNHVDESNKCLKSVELARSSIYDMLKQFEDPVPTLEKFLRFKNEIEQASKGNSAVSNEKIALLEEKVSDLTEELSELKNQEVTIASLREQINEMELDSAHDKQQAATEMSNEVQEVLKSWQNREFNLRQDNTNLAAENRKLQKLYNDISLQFSGIKQQLEYSHAQRESDADKSAEENQELQVQLAVARREIQTLADTVSTLKEKLEEFTMNDEAEQQEQQSQRRGNHHQFSPSSNQSSSAASPYFNNNNNNNQSTPQNQLQQHSSGGEEASSERKIILELSEKISNLEQEKQHELNTARETIESLQKSLQEMRDWGTEVNKLYERLKDSYDVAKQDNHSLRRKYDDAINDARELRRQVIELEGALSVTESEKRENNSNNGIIVGKDNNNNNRESTTTTTIISIPDAAVNNNNNKSSSSSTLDALIAQRDNLKRRLLNLEDASSRELTLLKDENSSMKAERQGLLVEIAKLSGNLPSSGGSSNSSSTTATVNSSNNNSNKQPPNVLDLFGNLVARFVNANPTTRRIFVIYLLSIHLFFFLMLSMDT